jgi:hypothetical protein
MRNIVRLRLLMLSALVAVMISASGCASVGSYFEHRYRDFTRIADIGFTFSKKPQLGLYWNSLEILTLGYSNVEGTFIGWGGNQLGMTRMYNHCWAIPCLMIWTGTYPVGASYGQETIGWGPLLDTDRREDIIIRRRSGVLGIATSIIGWDPTKDGYGNGPDYTPACVHLIHLGYVGLSGNLRYTELVQFVVGWFGLDITGHDGDRYPIGKWSFPTRSEPEPVPEAAPAMQNTAPPPGPTEAAPTAP